MRKGTFDIFAYAVAACVVVIGPGVAAAQSNIAPAAKAFSLGQQAELAGNHRAASEHYELADRMVPSPEALRSAARARLNAGDESMAATHAEALERRYSDEKSRQMASEILASLRPKLARVSLSCTAPCGVVVDGGAVGVEQGRSHVFYVEPGRHTIGADFGDGATKQEVLQGLAGKSASLSISAPETPTSTAAADVRADVVAPSRAGDSARGGLRMRWFVVSAAVTVALGGAWGWSVLDVMSKNDDYEAMPTQDKLDAGQSAENRTTILAIATGAAALTTGVIAWKTRWSSSAERESLSTVGVAPADGGAVLVLGGTFQ